MSGIVSTLAIPAAIVSDKSEQKLAKYRQQVSALSEEIDAATLSLRQVTENPDQSLDEMRQQLHSAEQRLHSLYREVTTLAADRGNLLSTLRSDVEAILAERGATLDKVRKRTRTALEKAGQAAVDNPIARVAPAAAAIQFERLVEASSEVRNAKAAAELAGQNLNTWNRLCRESQAVENQQHETLRAITLKLLRI